MAKSSILGGDPVPVTPRGHSTGDLGPSDSSDSGSDIAGAPGLADDAGLDNDAGTTSDVDRGRGAGPDVGDVDLDSDTDAEGTGERRSAGRDDTSREANDILPDAIVRDPGGLTIEPESEEERPERSKSDKST
ncbi:MAG TPA: hypothetical protein VJ673_07975 [Aromatoleum sp.]|uniref:hypothetical protein n=1 Tax=Aromatoleum sp. TaxID=2307007 RepID=UPI002B46DFAE|nr:hypothetical protein [Aromatoleum sp.]HJV25610.1 hypothetical protein [Aromatoleum sp.]